MIKRPPYGFKYFKKIIMKHIDKNKEWYLDRCKTLDEKYRNKTLNFSLYNMSINCNYEKILDEISEIIEKNSKTSRKKRKIRHNSSNPNVNVCICKGYLKNGNKCTYRAQPGKEYCRIHDKE